MSIVLDGTTGVTTPGLSSTSNATVTGTLNVTGDIYTVAWADYFSTSTKIGWAATPTGVLFYKKVGKLVFVNVQVTGTSNSSNTNVTLPYSAATAGPTYWGGAMTEAVDNGVTSAVAARWILGAASNQVTFQTTFASGSWTAAGTKTAWANFFYQID